MRCRIISFKILVFNERSDRSKEIKFHSSILWRGSFFQTKQHRTIDLSGLEVVFELNPLSSNSESLSASESQSDSCKTSDNLTIINNAGIQRETNNTVGC